MKTIIATLFLLVSLAADGQSVQQAWTTEKVFDVPESVLYDAESDALFVSNIAGKPTEKKINAADLGYIPGTRTILIPTFFDNRISAISLLNN